MATWDIWRSRTQAAPAAKFSVAEIMLPDHLRLRVVSQTDRRLANWPAYKFGVETLLRAYGLEVHVDAAMGALRQPGAQASTEQWEAEEELCRAVIGFNVKDFTEVFGESLLLEESAGEIWQCLSGLPKVPARAGMVEGGDECKSQ